jgi:DNA repair protein RecO (recombination protein O)
MTGNIRHARLTPCYILHHRAYRDTSRILEVQSREFGRLSVFARGARGPKVRYGALLQPFSALLLSWSGRGEAPNLTGAELTGEAMPLPGAALMSAFYLNELLLKLTAQHDPAPGIFDIYHAALQTLKQGAPIAPTLREFERSLLQMLGYGADLKAVLEHCLEGRELKTRAVARSIARRESRT